MYCLLISSIIVQGIYYSQSAVIVGLHDDNTDLRKSVLKNYYGNEYLTKRNSIVRKKEVDACADVLTEKQCKKLFELAENVGMRASSVADALKDASIQGAVTKNGIYKKAVQYLEERMACDLLISQFLCLKIIRAAAANKVSYHEVDGVLQMLIAQGVENKDVLTKKLMEFITTGNMRDTAMQNDIIDMPVRSMRNEEDITRSFKRNILNTRR